MAFRAPLLGYNTNVRHKGKLYHIQTEDSGVAHPHVITHLFADGGRIVASKKTSYAEHLGSDNLQETVKKLMQAQHKAMFVALRDGHYDEEGAAPETARELAPATKPSEASEKMVRAEPPRPPEPPPAALQHKPLYDSPRPAARALAEKPKAPPAPPARASIFGSDLLSEKSLDEVILSYLAADESDG